MLRGTTERLEDLIIAAFSHHPQITAGALLEIVAKRGRRYTIQAVYQELRKLQAQRIVTKVGDRYMLRVAWVLELLEFAEGLYQGSIGPGGIDELLPAAGERVSWDLPNASRLVTFWAQVNLAIVASMRSQHLFEYLPHVWFHLAAGADEQQFLSGLKRAGAKYHCAVGHETLLDRLYLRYANSIGAEVRFGQSPFVPAPETYHGIAGEFLVTVRLGRRVRQEIERIYSAVTRPQDVPFAALNTLFNSRERCRLTLERATTRANRIRRNFLDFFGLRADVESSTSVRK